MNKTTVYEMSAVEIHCALFCRLSRRRVPTALIVRDAIAINKPVRIAAAAVVGHTVRLRETWTTAHLRRKIRSTLAHNQ